MNNESSAPRKGLLHWACAALLAVAAPAAMATHIGEELTIDQQAVTSSDQLLNALRQYETTPAAQRAAALPRLLQLAEQRRERMLALIERNPRLAALRVLPAAARNRLPAQVQALVERDVSIAGTVLAQVADDFERGRSQTRLQVQDNAGQRFELRLADATDREQLGWVGKRASVAATQFDRHLLVLDKRGLQLLAADGSVTTSATLATTTAAVQGAQSTLVVMLNFTDKAIECSAADLQGRLFGASGATLDQGYRQSSNNLVSFSGQVIGPFNVNYSSTGSCDYNGWAAAANAAAQAAGFSPSNYKRVSYTMPRNANCGWTGLGALGGSQATPTWVQQCTSTGLFSHEIGHNLNFHHAATPGTEYGDGSDPMGGAKLVQSNAANRVMAGWTAGSQLQDVSSGGSYVVSALESTAPTSPQVLRLRKADTNESYYVSLRQPVGVDTNLWTIYQSTLSVHKSSGTMPAYTYLLASLGAGQSWSDSVNGITVTSQGVSGSAATVSIGFGGATCTRQPPGLSIAPASQSAAPGTSLGYALTVTNNNSAACPSSTFNLGQTLPSGFTGSFAPVGVALGAGASATVAWNVASASTSADASYTLTATASEATVSNSTQAHAAYTVLGAVVPPPPPPPPPPTDTTPPAVSITSPTAGAVIGTRLVSFGAQASDNVGVAAVEFYVDGKLIATDTAAPYGASWNRRKAAAGLHSIKVRAIDVNGNAAEQTISINLN